MYFMSASHHLTFYLFIRELLFTSLLQYFSCTDNEKDCVSCLLQQLKVKITCDVVFFNAQSYIHCLCI